MTDFDANQINYSFNALRGSADGETLAYLIALIDGHAHPVNDPDTAFSVIAIQYEIDEIVLDPEELLCRQDDLPDGYRPLTPVMIVRNWCPIEALMHQKLMPVRLRRGAGPDSVACGSWDPVAPLVVRENPENDHELFWMVFGKASEIAAAEGKVIHVTAVPGWDYEAAIDSLVDWNEVEFEAAKRVIWQRTING